MNAPLMSQDGGEYCPAHTLRTIMHGVASEVPCGVNDDLDLARALAQSIEDDTTAEVYDHVG